MVRRRVRPEHVASDMRADAGETLSKSAGGTRGKCSTGEASIHRKELQSSSVDASGANVLSRHSSTTGPKWQTKGWSKSERVQSSTDDLCQQPFGIQCEGINGSGNVRRNSSKSINCNGSTPDPKKRNRHQSSATTVDSSSTRPADSAEGNHPDRSDESSTDDDCSEIDLRAKTGKELHRQGEYSENGGSDTSEDECAVEASFGLFDPREDDKEALSCLLRHSLLQSDLKFSSSALQQLAATIAEQGNVGSILKTVDGENSEEDVSQTTAGFSRSSSTRDVQDKTGNEAAAGLSTVTPAVAGEESRGDFPKERASGAEARQGEGDSGTVVGFLTLLSFLQYPNVVAPFKEAVLSFKFFLLVTNLRRLDSSLEHIHSAQLNILSISANGQTDLVIRFRFVNAGAGTLLRLHASAEAYLSKYCWERSLMYAGKHATAECKAALERIFSGDTLKTEKRNADSKSNCSSEASAKPDTQLRKAGGGALNCGWLLKERLSNTPSQLIPQMYDSLLEDISWSLTTEEMDEDERPFYAYSHVCALTKVYKESEGRSQSRAPKKCNMRKTLPFEAVFPHPEDELLLDCATQSFAWPTGRSVRVSLEKGQLEATPRGGGGESEKTSPATLVCCCPEYLLFFALPFDQFRQCKNAIAARAIEGAV